MEVWQNRMGRLFDRNFFDFGEAGSEMAMTNWNPTVDVFEDENNIVVKADLPGVDKENVKVDLKDNVLSISGERSDEKELKEESFYRKERAYGKFCRSFTLPSGVDGEKIKAEYKDGVLNIEIPKPEGEKVNPDRDPDARRCTGAGSS
jgi:HSP20 family protein